MCNTSLTKNAVLFLTTILISLSINTNIIFAAKQGIEAINEGRGVTENEVIDSATTEEVKHRSFDYVGEGVPNSDPILYVGTYNMYTDSGTASFTLSTSLEDKIRVVGPFSPSTLNHYYLCERESYKDACLKNFKPNHWCMMDISVNNLPVKPEIATKAIYIKEFGDYYISAVMINNFNPNYAKENAIIQAKVKEIIDSISIKPNE